MWGRAYWPRAMFGQPYWPVGATAPAPVAQPTEPPGGGRRRVGRQRVEHVVRFEPEERPRGRPVEPPPAIATPAPPSPPAAQVEPARARPFTFDVQPPEPLVLGGPLSPPGEESLALARVLSPHELERAARKAADDRLRVLLFGVVTLS